jgi:hypothetical protein
VRTVSRRVKAALLQALLAVLLSASFAFASKGLRVRVQRPLDEDVLIDEAVVRVIGELGALGFDVEVLRRRPIAIEEGERPRLDPGTEGALVFAREGESVVVSAWVSTENMEFTQRFNTKDSAVTAEVIAVRAVEALRGILSAPSESGDAEARSPGDTQGGTQAPPATARHDTLGSLKEPRGRQLEDLPPTAERLQVVGFLAPWLGIEASELELFGVGANLAVGRNGWFAGVGYDYALLSSELQDAVATVAAGRQRGFILLRVEQPLTANWPVFLQLNGGLARYAFSADAEPGFLALERTEMQLFGGLALGGAHWFGSNVGAFVSGEVAMLKSPLRVRVAGRGIGLLGAPSVSMGLGLAARY